MSQSTGKPQNKSKVKLLDINVGGQPYRFPLNYLLASKTTRLGRIATAFKLRDSDSIHRLCDGVLGPHELFFNRSTSAFKFVEEFHRLGKVDYFFGLPRTVVDRESKYWMLPSDVLESYDQQSAALHAEVEREMTEEFRTEHYCRNQQCCTHLKPDNNTVRTSYDETETPPRQGQAAAMRMVEYRPKARTSVTEEVEKKRKVNNAFGFCPGCAGASKTAMTECALRSITALLAIAGIIAQVLGSMEDYRLSSCISYEPNSTLNDTGIMEFQQLEKLRITQWLSVIGHEALAGISAEHCAAMYYLRVFCFIEVASSIWFIIYYIIRIVQNKWRFIFTAEGIILPVCVIPVAVEMGIVAAISFHGATDSLNGFLSFTKIIRTLRVLMIFLILLQIEETRLMLKALFSSGKELLILFAFLIAVTVFMGAVVFELEANSEGTQFTSIPATCWFVIVTLTTVGYGDMVPQTGYGRLMGAVIIMLAVVCLALPVSIVVEKLQQVYAAEAARKKRAEEDQGEGMVALGADNYIT